MVRSPLKITYVRGEYLKTMWECAEEVEPEVSDLFAKHLRIRPEQIDCDGWYSMKPVLAVWREAEHMCREEAFVSIIRKATQKTIVGRYLPLFTTPRMALKMVPRKLGDIFIGIRDIGVSVDTRNRCAIVSVPPHDMGKVFSWSIKGFLLGVMDTVEVNARVKEIPSSEQDGGLAFGVTW